MPVAHFLNGDILVSADKLLGAWDASYCFDKGVPSLGNYMGISAPSFTLLTVHPGLKDCGDVPRANVLSISYAAAPDTQNPVFAPVLQRECAELGKVCLTRWR